MNNIKYAFKAKLHPKPVSKVVTRHRRTISTASASARNKRDADSQTIGEEQEPPLSINLTQDLKQNFVLSPMHEIIEMSPGTMKAMQA